jgi:hypothetical protein
VLRSPPMTTTSETGSARSASVQVAASGTSRVAASNAAVSRSAVSPGSSGSRVKQTVNTSASCGKTSSVYPSPSATEMTPRFTGPKEAPGRRR